MEGTCIALYQLRCPLLGGTLAGMRLGGADNQAYLSSTCDTVQGLAQVYKGGISALGQVTDMAFELPDPPAAGRQALQGLAAWLLPVERP